MNVRRGGTSVPISISVTLEAIRASSIDLYKIQLRRLEYFTLHLFIFCQHSISFPEVDTDIFTDITLHDAGYDVFFFLKILIIHRCV